MEPDDYQFYNSEEEDSHPSVVENQIRDVSQIFQLVKNLPYLWMDDMTEMPPIPSSSHIQSLPQASQVKVDFTLRNQATSRNTNALTELRSGGTGIKNIDDARRQF
jgi:hypothetical protein